MISRKRFQEHRRGFTLIELLVVVAIIALLISILLPSLDRARRQARQLVCATNLKSQNSAALLYAADNEDWLPCAMLGIDERYDQGIDGKSLYPGYNSYATAIMHYLGWSGLKNVKLRGTLTTDIHENTMDMWNSEGRPSPYDNDSWRARCHAVASIEMFQCTDYPEFEPNPELQWDPDEEPASPSVMPLDYVTSAVPIPYTENNFAYDRGRMTFDFFEPPNPVDVNLTAYVQRRRLEDFMAGVSPADYIYVTEGHTGLDTKTPGALVFHHFFAGSQLPFAAEPRMAVDSRHPAGVNAMFFDGHVETMELHELDPATDGNDFDEYCRRLKHITYVPESFR